MESSNDNGTANAIGSAGDVRVEGEMYALRDLLREKRDLYERLAVVEGAIAVRLERLRDLESL
jgi:hypothetical protein